MAESTSRTLELTIRGMDCADCARHVEAAVRRLSGVARVQVFLSTEKAAVEIDPKRVSFEDIARAVRAAGYAVERPAQDPPATAKENVSAALTRTLWTALGAVFGIVLFVVVIGEWLGFFERVTARVPYPLGVMLVAALGYPVFRNVARAALRRQVTSHTLMTVGALAALAVGEWATAAIVAFFMRVGEAIERLTAEQGRAALKLLLEQAPRRARVERGGVEMEVDVDDVHPGEVTVVRPGEAIPVDGEVIQGQATVNQAPITGESLPVEVAPGSRVFAAALVLDGALKVRARAVGRETTYGRIVRLVEEAEASRGTMGRLADRFSALYLPVVALIALLTYALSGNATAAVAVLVVACSCAFALATPVAVLAGVGAAARRGVVVKGGRAIEALGRADVLLVDKTGTLTFGRPEITDVVPLDGRSEAELLALAAAAERYSEHPLAQAAVQAARSRGLVVPEPEAFEALPGRGVRARVGGREIIVGSARWVLDRADLKGASGVLQTAAARLAGEGKALLYVAVDGEPAGLLAAADGMRPEVPEALSAVRALGVSEIVILTGDHEAAARALAARLGVAYRAGLLPEEKIRIVKAYQAEGRRVAMVGDGVNDAPALAQADVGIAMGEAGTAIASEAAHVVLLRDDWRLIPEAFRIARRTVRVIRGNLGFTVAYSAVGLALAAVGLLPPVLAAALQSVPDVAILGNSARLIRQ
ncbi:MAG: cation-translocating P-type ATPase [Hydrogenibacillus sp.]|nr:cation-translocating P-type ATPase [Hydrogenibacillus sp.]